MQKVVLVAGGAKNLAGLDQSADLARKGPILLFHYHSPSANKKLRQTAAGHWENSAGGRIAVARRSDKARECQPALREQRSAFGRIDIAINNRRQSVGSAIWKQAEDEVLDSDVLNIMQDSLFFIKKRAAIFHDMRKSSRCDVLSGRLYRWLLHL